MSFVATRTGRVFYEQRGTGRPVVMLHAALHDHTDFGPVCERLAARYRTIAVDWPDHGRSDCLPPGQRASASLFAGVLADLIVRVELAPAVFIGNSVGGYAAARLALDQPARVAGLVLVNSGGFTRRTAASRLTCRLLGNPQVTRWALPRLVPGYMKAANDHDRAITAETGCVLSDAVPFSARSRVRYPAARTRFTAFSIEDASSSRPKEWRINMAADKIVPRGLAIP